jgi:hypothetical protein
MKLKQQIPTLQDARDGAKDGDSFMISLVPVCALVGFGDILLLVNH